MSDASGFILFVGGFCLLGLVRCYCINQHTPHDVIELDVNTPDLILPDLIRRPSDNEPVSEENLLSPSVDDVGTGVLIIPPHVKYGIDPLDCSMRIVIVKN